MAGEQLAQLGGVAALLRYPMPVDDMLEEMEGEAEGEEERQHVEEEQNDDDAQWEGGDETVDEQQQDEYSRNLERLRRNLHLLPPRYVVSAST